MDSHARAVDLIRTESLRLETWKDGANRNLKHDKLIPREMQTIAARAAYLLDEVASTELPQPGKISHSRGILEPLKWKFRKDKVMKMIAEIRQLNDTLYSLETLRNDGVNKLLKRSNQSEIRLQRIQQSIERVEMAVFNNTATGKKASSTAKHAQPHRAQHPPRKQGDEPSTLRSLFDLAVEGLGFVAAVLESDDLFGLHDQLQVWGVGLFSHEFGLDAILHADCSIHGYPDLGSIVFRPIFLKILLLNDFILIALEPPEEAIDKYLDETFNTVNKLGLLDDVLHLTTFIERLLVPGPENPVAAETESPVEVQVTQCLLQLEKEIKHLYSLNPAIKLMQALSNQPGAGSRKHLAVAQSTPAPSHVTDNDNELMDEIADLLLDNADLDMKDELYEPPPKSLASMFDDEGKRATERRKRRRQTATDKKPLTLEKPQQISNVESMEKRHTGANIGIVRGTTDPWEDPSLNKPKNKPYTDATKIYAFS